MSSSTTPAESPGSGPRSSLVAILVGIAVVLPLGLLWGVPQLPARGAAELIDLASRYEPSPLTFEQQETGTTTELHPQITNVQITDLDGDGRNDILACDAVKNTVWWYRRSSGGEWEATPLAGENSLSDPAHATVVDIDGDGDADVLVAILSSVLPSDQRIGQVVLLENQGDLSFEKRVLMDDMRRVADVQAADFDADGDLDLAVAEFGYKHGRVLWLENLGDLKFLDHELLIAPGAIHVPIADYDSDGDSDIAAIVTQNEEEVWIFENPGTETFEPIPHRVWYTPNYDLGGAGLVKTDLDGDGDVDFLLAAGDNLEHVYPCPQPYHGCLWLENRGEFEFVEHRIAHQAGTYAADSADLDGDGDMDVVLASLFNDSREPGAASLTWLENDGQQNFTPWQIDHRPSNLCTVSCGDLNDDGLPDIAAGSLQLFEPLHHVGRASVWYNRAGGGR